jgi:hypothetical protein
MLSIWNTLNIGNLTGHFDPEDGLPREEDRDLTPPKPPSEDNEGLTKQYSVKVDYKITLPKRYPTSGKSL